MSRTQIPWRAEHTARDAPRGKATRERLPVRARVLRNAATERPVYWRNTRRFVLLCRLLSWPSGLRGVAQVL